MLTSPVRNIDRGCRRKYLGDAQAWSLLHYHGDHGQVGASEQLTISLIRLGNGVREENNHVDLSPAWVCPWYGHSVRLAFSARHCLLSMAKVTLINSGILYRPADVSRRCATRTELAELRLESR